MQNKRLTVCHVVNRLDVGGMENGVINISNMLDRACFQPVVCCLEAPGTMAYRLKPDVVVHEMGFAPGGAFLRPVPMTRYFRALKPDIVHTHSWGGGSVYGILGAYLARVPVIVNGEHGRIFNRWHQKTAQRLLSHLCNSIFSVSEGLKKRVADELGIRPDRIEVIPNGVDTSVFCGAPCHQRARGKVLETAGGAWGDTDFIIGSIGRIKQQKNQLMLLQALALLAKMDVPRVPRLVFAGDDSDAGYLKKYADVNGLNGHVVFVGERDDIPALLSACDVVASTSIAQWEGMSNVMLEAMASGIAVIGTNASGMSELIEDGHNGFLIQSGDTHALAMKLRALIEDSGLLKRLGVEAREGVLRRYTLQQMVASYEKAYASHYVKKHHGKN